MQQDAKAVNEQEVNQPSDTANAITHSCNTTMVAADTREALSRRPTKEKSNRSKTSSKSKFSNNTGTDDVAPFSKPKISPYRKDDRKLFVGGLGHKVDNENFREFFEQFGKVIDSVVMIDRETNRHRGFGFVSFKNAADAMKVLVHGNEGKPIPPQGFFTSGRIELFGKMCEVKVSEPKKGAEVSLTKSSKGSDIDDTNSKTSENEDLPDVVQLKDSQIDPSDTIGTNGSNSSPVPSTVVTGSAAEDQPAYYPNYEHPYYYGDGGTPCYYSNGEMYCYNPGQYQPQGMYQPYQYYYPVYSHPVPPMPLPYYAPAMYEHAYPTPNTPPIMEDQTEGQTSQAE